MEHSPARTTDSRSARRVGVELMVRCNHRTVRSTVMLKDMTRHGARIDGLHAPHVGEAIGVMLPGEPPRMAFVVWTHDGVSGLEFGEVLPRALYLAMVRDYAVGRQPTPVPAPETRAAA